MRRLNGQELDRLEAACFGAGTSSVVTLSIVEVRILLAIAQREARYAETLEKIADRVHQVVQPGKPVSLMNAWPVATSFTPRHGKVTYTKPAKKRSRK